MKIDLHCHTKAIKKGDGPGRNVIRNYSNLRLKMQT